MKMKGARAVAELQAALLIVTITISLAYLVYSQVKAPRANGGLTFYNRSTLLGGSSSPLILLRVNTSMPASIVSMQLDSTTSTDGILSFDGHYYSTSSKLCSSDVVTFFSVYSASAGTLRVSTDGTAWISGHWTNSISVSAGWEEILLFHGSNCSLTLPDGTVVNSKTSAYISAIPSSAQNSTYFKFFIPSDGSTHTVLLVFQGGFDRAEI